LEVNGVLDFLDVEPDSRRMHVLSPAPLSALSIGTIRLHCHRCGINRVSPVLRKIAAWRWMVGYKKSQSKALRVTRLLCLDGGNPSDFLWNRALARVFIFS
jgi:hypothetical protein